MIRAFFPGLGASSSHVSGMSTSAAPGMYAYTEFLLHEFANVAATFFFPPWREEELFFLPLLNITCFVDLDVTCANFLKGGAKKSFRLGRYRKTPPIFALPV